MALRVVVPIQAAPGKRGELIELFRTRSQEVRRETGCEEFELYQSTERSDQMVLLERWADEAALEAHAVLNRQRGSDLSSLRTGITRLERYIMQA